MVLVLIKALRAVNGQSANRTPTRSTSGAFPSTVIVDRANQSALPRAREGVIDLLFSLVMLHPRQNA